MAGYARSGEEVVEGPVCADCGWEGRRVQTEGSRACLAQLCTRQSMPHHHALNVRGSLWDRGGGGGVCSVREGARKTRASHDPLLVREQALHAVEPSLP